MDLGDLNDKSNPTFYFFLHYNVDNGTRTALLPSEFHFNVIYYNYLMLSYISEIYVL